MIKTVVLVAIVALASSSGYATAIFTTGNVHQPNEENILFNTAQTGMTIMAHTNITHTNVQFSSKTDVLIAKGGQSDIDAMDGLVNDVTFTVPGHTFADFILNPFKPATGNDLIVTAVTNMGTFMFTYGDIHGNNFLTITTINGEVLDSVTVDSASGFQNLKQPRVSGVSGETFTPEPNSMTLLGSGLGLLGITAVRRKLKK